MLLMQQQELSGEVLPEPNTFIGGVGATSVTSASDLASLTSLSVGDIDNFVVDANNNVSCYIGVGYSINGLAFQGDLALTYYIDFDGYCTSFSGSNAIRDTKKLEIFYMPSLTDIKIQAFIIDGVGTGTKMDIWSATALTPIGATAGNDGNFVNRQFDSLYSNSANATNNGGLPDGDFSSANCVIDNLKYSTNTNAPTATTGLNTISKGATYIELGWTAVTHTNNIDWYLIFIDGNYVSKTNTTSFLYADITTATSYNFKIIAIDEMGNASHFSATYTETTNATDITDLALETAYGTALKVDWSFVADTEIDYYEVYVDDVLKQTQTTPEAFIGGLTLNTSYDIKVRGKYISGNFTSYSNVLTQSTNSTEDIPYGSIISYWKFNGNSNDAVGSNNGTDTAISYVAGLIDNCADFTAGNTSIITIPDADNLSFGNGTTDSPFSFVTLVKWDVVGNSVLYSKVVSTREYEAYYLSGKILFRIVSNGNVADRIDMNVSFTPTAGVWYCIINTYDGSSTGAGMKTYINGTLYTPTITTAGTYVAMVNTGNNLHFGKYQPSTSYSLDGYNNAVAIFDTEVTAGEASDISDKLLVANEHLI